MNVNDIRHVHNIIFKRGNIFDSDAQVITNTINTVGVMGAGLAKQFKERFPEMFSDYQERCRKGEVQIGRPYLWKPPNGEGKWVLNFPTKRHWRENSRLEWIEEGLRYLLEHYEKWEIQSLAMPALGCELGGLNWEEQVKPLMIHYLSQMKIPVEIYEPLLIKDLLKYVEMLVNISEEMMKVDMKSEAKEILDKALEVVEGITQPREHSRALAKIAQGLAKVNKFDQALQMARGIRILWWRSSALAKIAEEMTEAGMLDEARQVLKQALEEAKKVKGPQWRSKVLSTIVQVMARAGMFDEALQIAAWIEMDDDRVKVLAVIGREMAQRGFLEEAKRIFNQTLKSVRKCLTNE